MDKYTDRMFPDNVPLIALTGIVVSALNKGEGQTTTGTSWK